MKRNTILNRLFAILMAVMTICCLVCPGYAENEEAERPAFRTDLTEEDYIGTWKLKTIMIQGFPAPAEMVNLHATIVITAGQIEITDVFDEKNEYETTFEDGLLCFMINDEQKLIVYITEDGQLYMDQEAEVYSGSIEDEQSPVAVIGGNTLQITQMDKSYVGQMYEKVTEEETTVSD